MRKIYYYKDRPVYKFTYRWTDDYHYNKGFKNMLGDFIGTQRDWNDNVDDLESNYGFNYWELKKEYATKEDYEGFLYDIKRGYR